ncbi:hypothetical protein NP284_02045, partial [Rhodopseudomonas pseudopalustris]|uniref:hypothetical protein n=1 Tax=Rhodopseudomonas pseudopalustris TaxID=1513892 RepID=UPI003F9D8396
GPLPGSRALPRARPGLSNDLNLARRSPAGEVLIPVARNDPHQRSTPRSPSACYRQLPVGKPSTAGVRHCPVRQDREAKL